MVNLNASARGGAIAMRDEAALVVEDCTFENNFASNVGGALFLANDGGITIRRSLFLANTTDAQGAAIDINCSAVGPIVVENSTFYGNQGDNVVFVCGAMTLDFVHCSFANNTGALVYLGGASSEARFLGSALHHLAGAICQDNGSGGTFSSLGGNVHVGEASACAFGGNDVADDPELASAPANNGGPTQTLAIDAPSPARGAAATATCPAVDQRGYERVDGACDAGAFEFGGAPPP
jgi:hypothetical protein